MRHSCEDFPIGGEAEGDTERVRVVGLSVVSLCVAGYFLLCVGQGRGLQEAPTLAFASFAPIETNIYIGDGDGDHARLLFKQPGQDYNPCFSRDGAWIIFTSLRGGSRSEEHTSELQS